MKKVILTGCVLARRTFEEDLVRVWNKCMQQKVETIQGLSGVVNKRNCIELLDQDLLWCCVLLSSCPSCGYGHTVDKPRVQGVTLPPLPQWGLHLRRRKLAEDGEHTLLAQGLFVKWLECLAVLAGDSLVTRVTKSYFTPMWYHDLRKILKLKAK